MIILTTIPTIISSIISSCTGGYDCKLCAVILCSSLGNRHKNKLMVTRTGHGASPIIASWQPTRNFGGKQTISISCIVDPFEEHKCCCIKRLLRIEIWAHILYGNVSVPNYFAFGELLGSRIIGFLCIRERPRNKVDHLDAD